MLLFKGVKRNLKVCRSLEKCWFNRKNCIVAGLVRKVGRLVVQIVLRILQVNLFDC